MFICKPSFLGTFTSFGTFTILLFQMKEVLSKASSELVGKPLFVGVLSDKQWHQLSELQEELQDEYRMRREMLLKRLDVTIQSFQVSFIDFLCT